MRTAVLIGVLLVAPARLAAAGPEAVIPVTLAREGDVTVTATYKGKGPVDEKHPILVFLFDHPNPTADSRPISLRTIAKNGGSATFMNVAQPSVYITLVYDEQSNYDGKSGPPPPGIPIGAYTKAGKPVPVTPGPAAKVTATFDDSQRWK